MGLFDKKDGFAEKRHVKSVLVSGTLNENRLPKVSILMPIYNHPQYFEQALLSALNQNCDFEYEIIVCDNNHPQFQQVNQEIARKYECDKLLYYVNEENIGGLSNWNRCVELANSSYVTYCHDDDMLNCDCLSRLYDVRKTVNSDIAIIGNYDTIDQNGTIRSQYLSRNSESIDNISLTNMLFRNYTNGCGCLYNRSCLISIGGFVGDYNPCPDYYLNTKYVSEYGACLLDHSTFYYRITNTNDSASCFNQIGIAATRIREEIVTKLPYPKLFLSLLVRSLSYSDSYFNHKLWNPSSINILSRFCSLLPRTYIRLSKVLLDIKY